MPKSIAMASLRVPLKRAIRSIAMALILARTPQSAGGAGQQFLNLSTGFGPRLRWRRGRHRLFLNGAAQ